MVSTLGLSSPRKNWLLRSVRTTSLSTVNCTLRQNSLCSSGVIVSLETKQPRECAQPRETPQTPCPGGRLSSPISMMPRL